MLSIQLASRWPGKRQEANWTSTLLLGISKTPLELSAQYSRPTREAILSNTAGRAVLVPQTFLDGSNAKITTQMEHSRIPILFRVLYLWLHIVSCLLSFEAPFHLTKFPFPIEFPGTGLQV